MPTLVTTTLILIMSLLAGGWSPESAATSSPINSESPVQATHQAKQQAAVATIDDLSQLVELRTGWRYQPGDNLEWAAPDFDDSSWTPVELPLPRGYGIRGKQNWGWFRIELQFDRNNHRLNDQLRYLAIIPSKVVTSYALYANGTLISSFPAAPITEHINFDHQPVISIPRRLINDDGRLVLAMRVFRDDEVHGIKVGGPTEGTTLLGDERALREDKFYTMLPRLLGAIIFVYLGLAHLYLYYLNTSLRPFLWFGILGVVFAAYTMMTSDWRYYLPVDFVSNKKIEYILAFLTSFLMVRFITSFIGVVLPRKIDLYVSFSLVLAATALPGTSLQWQLTELRIWGFWIMPLQLYIFGLLINETRKGNRKALVLLPGATLLGIAVIGDLLVVFGNTHSVRLGSIAFALLIATMALSLLHSFVRSFLQLENAVEDQTQRLKSMHQTLSEMANYDTLTGLMNRYAFENEAAKYLNHRKPGDEHCLMLLDIDHFKGFNDRYGHHTGDMILSEVGLLLRNQFRDTDLVARWGGEEFIVLMPYVSLVPGYQLAERVRQHIEKTIIAVDGVDHKVTVTMGITEYMPGMTLRDLIKVADQALYQGKTEGRNQVVVAGPSSVVGKSPQMTL